MSFFNHQESDKRNNGGIIHVDPSVLILRLNDYTPAIAFLPLISRIEIYFSLSLMEWSHSLASLINSAFFLYISWGLLFFPSLFAEKYGSMIPPLNKKTPISQFRFFFSQNCVIQTNLWSPVLRGEKTDIFSELWVYISQLGLDNLQLCVKLAILTFFLRIASFWEFISRNSDFKTCNCESISQFWEKKVRIVRYKVATNFFIFYSVVETGFHRQETVVNISCFNSCSAVSEILELYFCCQNNLTVF